MAQASRSTCPASTRPTQRWRRRRRPRASRHGEYGAGLRGFVRECLEAAGYTVLEARHGVEALKISERHPAPVQLLLTDVVMPLMSGRELALQIRASRPEIRVLYMSGYTD